MIKTKEDIVKDYELWVYRQLGRLVSSQTANVGSFISTDGIKLIWSGGGSSLPSQSGNAGKFLTTDGTNTSWATVTAPVWGAITGTLSSQTDLQSALDAKEATANKGSAGGYASLDGTGKVPSSQLPSYVDDVLEYANLAALPVTGSTGIIYVTIDNNKTYRWTGSAYTEISPNIPAGSNTQIQFNNAGAFGASSNLTWDGATLMALAVKASNGTGNGFGLGDGYWFIDREGVAGNNGAMRFQGKLFSVHGDVAAFKFVDFSNTVLTSINTTGQFNITPLALASAQATSALNIAQTWNTTGAPTAIKLNVTNAASSANSRLIDLQLDASSVFYVTRSGTGVFTGYLYGGSALGITSKSLITSPINGNFRLTNSAESDFGLLQFGGTTSSFPALKRSTTELQVKLADDSGYADIRALSFYTSTGAIQITSNFITSNGSALNIGYSGSNATKFYGGGSSTTHLIIDNNSTAPIQFGGSTSSFPALKRNGTALNVRLADDSADAPLTCGALATAGSITLAAGTELRFASKSRIDSGTDGLIRLTNAAQADFTALQFGGTTSSFPALKRSSTTLQARLADDSDFAAVQSLYQRFGAGSPEGVVTAPVGAIYHRTDGGAGTSFYVKESGVSNTGWVSK